MRKAECLSLLFLKSRLRRAAIHDKMIKLHDEGD